MKPILAGLLVLLSLTAAAQTKTYRYFSPYKNLSITKMRASLAMEAKPVYLPVATTGLYGNFNQPIRFSFTGTSTRTFTDSKKGWLQVASYGLLIARSFTRYGNSPDGDLQTLRANYRVRD